MFDIIEKFHHFQVLYGHYNALSLVILKISYMELWSIVYIFNPINPSIEN